MVKVLAAGSYILIAGLPEAAWLRVGKLGEVFFRAGYYAYVGSAMRGFQSRLPHHLRKTSKPHWHIDYLLQAGSVERIVTFKSETRQECAVARFLMQRLDYIPGFGCSDCRCNSHLFYVYKVKQPIP
jgi:Uri superfamily endonuclease